MSREKSCPFYSSNTFLFYCYIYSILLYSNPFYFCISLFLLCFLFKLVITLLFFITSNLIFHNKKSAHREIDFLEAHASQHLGLSVCLSACLSVPVSFWRGFVDNTNIYHCWGVHRVFYNYPGHPIPEDFSSILLKLYRKAVTHSEEVGWWSILMVECVTTFFTI